MIKDAMQAERRMAAVQNLRKRPASAQQQPMQSPPKQRKLSHRQAATSGPHSAPAGGVQPGYGLPLDMAQVRALGFFFFFLLGILWVSC